LVTSREKSCRTSSPGGDPPACAGWHGFFTERLARVLDGNDQRSEARDAEDDAIWRRRTMQYEELIREVLAPPVA
jgi:hypothetical protein